MVFQLAQSMVTASTAITAFLTPSWRFFFACLFFLSGVLVGTFWDFNSQYLYLAIWLSLLLAIWAIRRYPTVSFLVFMLLALLVGFSRTEIHDESLKALSLQALVGESLTLQGQVVEPPIAQQRSTRFRFRVNKVVGVEGPTDKNKITVIARPYPKVSLGDELQLDCRLVREEIGRYRGSVVCLFPDIIIEKNETGSFALRGVLEEIKTRFIISLQKVFPEPASGFITGLLVGGSASLSPSWRDDLNSTGTTHLVALSGFNITIIAGFLTILLRLIAWPRRWHIFVIAVILTLFVLMVGAGASVVRAAIMGMLVVLARSLGRQSSTRNALIFTAAAMVAINPMILVYDLGFQLSFLATLGIIYLYPIFEIWTKRWPEFLKMKEALLMTVAAQIFVVPFIMYYFDRVSLIAPLVNMIVVPPIPFIMLLGFLGGLAGLIAVPLGQVVGLAGGLGASFVLEVIKLGGSMAEASLQVYLPFWPLFPYYALLGWWLFRYYHKRARPIISEWTG